MDAWKAFNEEAVELLVKILLGNILDDRDLNTILDKYGALLELDIDNSMQELFRSKKTLFDREFTQYGQEDEINLMFWYKTLNITSLYIYS